MVQTYIDIDGDVRDASSLTVPNDRVFRGAWKFNGDVVEVDMTKAREIHKDNLRVERKTRFEELDTEWFRAAETNNTVAQAEVASKKQALRDVTDDSRITNATTPDQLKALTLDVLLGS